MAEKRRKKSKTVADMLFRYAEFLGFGDLHMKIDHATGLRAVVAVHSTAPGPAIGGCRCIPYDSTEQAMADVLRLAQGMSYKAASAGLPHGGAKAALIKPKVIKDRKAYFEVFGDFIHELNGRYITAVDSGTTNEDMDIIATRTPYVTSTSAHYGDPSPYTAHGVLRGIQAAIKFQRGRDDLDGIHVAIQGLGHVGYPLATKLSQLGARLTVCDKDSEKTARLAESCGATVVEPDDIYTVPCDVFAPCAFGAILNLKTINTLNTTIIAGAANNQLAHHHHGVALLERGILYAPDFVINSAGLIYVASIYDKTDSEKAREQMDNIYERTLEIFERSKADKMATNEVAERMALKNLGKR